MTQLVLFSTNTTFEIATLTNGEHQIIAKPPTTSVMKRSSSQIHELSKLSEQDSELERKVSRFLTKWRN
ncbi:unnamed protein product [Trichobilharzia regenti]|nr:unnamed protein product [Trichobilharzia regenti]